jgi:hypothetical protein
MKSLVTLLLALVIAGPSAADGDGAADVEECMLGNLPQTTSVQTVVFRSTDRVGAVSELEAKIYWKRFDDGLNRVMLKLAKPEKLRGAALLYIEKKGDRRDLFVYLPAIGKVRRVTSRMVSTSMFGTDFAYEDFERLQGLTPDDFERRRLPDAEVEGQTLQVIETRPAEDYGSAYERAIAYVDRETCVPAKLELYERGDRLRKVLTVDRSRVTREGEGWIPRIVRMEDLRDDTHSELVVEEIEVGKPISRKFFSQRELESGGR